MDDVDCVLLKTLSCDGRSTYSTLGKLVHLTPNATSARVVRLRENGIIVGFTAQIDFQKLGASQAIIDVSLVPSASADDFEAFIMQQAGVREVHLMTGSVDYQVKVGFRSQSDLMRLVEAIRASGYAKDTYTRMIVRHLRRESPELIDEAILHPVPVS